jgi:large subunit ribosomal protein L13
MKTFIPTIDGTKRKWYVVDLQGAILGRAAIKVATVLRGKDKPIFTPHIDTGDHVIAINAAGMRVSGKNKADKVAYHHYSGYPGGLRVTTLADLMKNKPEDAFSYSVRKMLPKHRLGRKMFKKLHVYAGAEHPHRAQKPEMLKLG